MKAYQDFAFVYDELMDNIPYEEWCETLCKFIEKYGVSKPQTDEEKWKDIVIESNLKTEVGITAEKEKNRKEIKKEETKGKKLEKEDDEIEKIEVRREEIEEDRIEKKKAEIEEDKIEKKKVEVEEDKTEKKKAEAEEDKIEKKKVEKEEVGEKEIKEKLLESERNLVLDLGCGTGTLTQLLYHKGYDIIGIDNSEDMLNIAIEKRQQTGDEILYLLQDMRELELYSTVGTVISVCDCLNYILEEEELLKVFQLVNNYLYPGGLFLFDFNTVYKYEKVIGDTTIAENREDCSFIWENYYEEENQINEYDLTIFVREKNDIFRRFTETHFQRGYTIEQIKRLVTQAEMELIEVLDADTKQKVTSSSERIFVVARECKKMVKEAE